MTDYILLLVILFFLGLLVYSLRKFFGPIGGGRNIERTNNTELVEVSEMRETR